MENASKALIIAGAILISILLISVGILIFNSAKGTTNNANSAGNAMEVAARKERVKMLLSGIDIKNEEAFNNYIKTNYCGEDIELTAEKARELCELVTQRCIILYGKEYERATTHMTSDKNNSKIYCAQDKGYTIEDNLDESKKYKASTSIAEPGNGVSIYISEKS